MDPITLSLLMGGGSMLGSGLGYLFGQGDRDEADNYRDLALQQMAGIQTPSIDSMRETSVGDEPVYSLGPSAMAGIQDDPAVRNAQMQALQQMMGVANSGGMDAAAKAANFEAQNQAAQYEKSQRDAIAQNMAARGGLGSGNQLAMQLAAQQGGANTAAMAGQKAASDAQMRALQAMSQGGQMAGQLRGQDFSQNAAKAQAQDAIARFNAANSQDVAARRIGRLQGISNHNAGLSQQDFENQMRRAGGLAGAYDSRANSYDDRAGQLGRLGQGMGQGAGALGGAGYGLLNKRRGGGSGDWEYEYNGGGG